MKRLLIALALWLAPFAAFAQCNGVFPNNTVCGNVTGSGNLPRPTTPSAFLGAAGGANGQIQYNNGGALGGFTASGDATINTATGVVTLGIVPTAKGGTGVSNATNAAGGILASGSTNGTFLSRTLNAICVLAPTTCTQALGYTNIFWYGAVCDGTTDDTAAIQAAINSIGRAGGGLFIPATAYGGFMSGYPATGGCLIALPAVPLRANCALVVSRPIHMYGQGHGSLIKTPSSMANTTDNICMNVSDINWELGKFESFAIGEEGEYHPPSPVPYRRYGKRGLAFLINADPSGYQNVIVNNMLIGESFNDYSVWFEGLATQGSKIIHSTIFGGVAWNNVADSNQLLYNRLGGFGTFGIYVDAPGAGNTQITGNSLTTAAGLILNSGSGIIVSNNYIEAGTNTSPIGVMVEIRGNTSVPIITGNIIQTFSTPPSLPIYIAATVGSTMISDNYIGAPTTQGVTNFSATTKCNGLNFWSTSGTNVNNAGAGALRNAIGTVVADCP